MYYTYNYKNQKWISSDADIYQPLFTPFSVKQKKAWCSVHKKLEACGKALNGKQFYECSITAEVQALLSDYAKKLYGNIYEFILPLDTNELYDLGEAMHNCVGTLYRNAALKRLSIIVGMKLNGKYQACIEIKTKDKEITQALGPCNRNLPAEIRNIIRK